MSSFESVCSILLRVICLNIGFQFLLEMASCVSTDIMEYCQWETFNATCSPDDEVVLMETARYGRMRFGRCMKEDHGSVGCAAVVLPILDQLCSGHRSCQLTIPDAKLHSIHPCPKELMPYLEASYDCIKVQVGSPQTCALAGGHSIRSGSQGYIASISTVETGIGTAHCPWIIEAERGQKVNVTLFSFSSLVVGPGGCGWSVIIQEGNTSQEFPGCKSAARKKQIFTSQGAGSVKISLQIGEGVDPMTASNIIVRYQVFGCADVRVTSNSIVRRHEDTSVVTCLVTGQTHVMTCVDGHWIGDPSVNCSKTAAMESGKMEPNSSSTGFPFGLLLVIGAGVVMGIVMGILMLLSIVICLRKRKQLRTRSQTTDPLLVQKSTPDVDETSIYAHAQNRQQFQTLQPSDVICSNAATASLCPYHHLRYHQHQHHQQQPQQPFKHHHPNLNEPPDPSRDLSNFPEVISSNHYPLQLDSGTAHTSFPLYVLSPPSDSVYDRMTSVKVPTSSSSLSRRFHGSDVNSAQPDLQTTFICSDERSKKPLSRFDLIRDQTRPTHCQHDAVLEQHSLDGVS